MTERARGPYEMLLDHAAQENIPISALLELTNACNVDCEHCYLDLVPDKKLGVLSTDDWKRVFRELADEGTLFMTLTGGELMMRRDWFELASYARELQFALRLYTNGTLVDETQADRIASLEPLGVEISLLGATAETHDAIARRRGAFEKTLRGVRLLRERGINLLLKTVVMEKNVADLPKIEVIARELGCETFFDLQISPKNNGSQAPTALGPQESSLLEAARLAFAKQTTCSHDSHFDREAKLRAAPCGAGRRTVFIGPTGNVTPCTQWTRELGNVRDQAFGEIWWGAEGFAEIRAKRIGSFEACRTCDLLEVCTPCMALSVLERGVVDGPSPTKCRNALVRARALGVPGYPAGLALGGAEGGTERSSELVQLRRPPRAPAKVA
jgi:radical SAM protein with 4Fe4S-binding SPASM domain